MKIEHTPTPSSPLDPRRRAADDSEAGVALVVALLLAVALSAIGASLLLLAKTDTYASMNYRMMSQARYAAEAGVLRTVNYLTQTYVSPGGGTDPLVNYDTTVSPVTYNGEPVVLSADPNVTTNYPVSSVAAAFTAAVAGSLNAGAPVAYTASARLMSMREIEEYGATSIKVVQTWHITGTGTISGTRPATVEVSSVLERQIGSAHSFGVFATKIGCGAAEFGGGSEHDSYDSSSITLQNGQPVTDLTGGRVGTNGNLNVNGNAQIWGTLSTPRTGVGKCKNGSIVALTATGQAEVHEGLIQLPQALEYPTPEPPNPMPPTTAINMSSSSCAVLGIAAPTCTGAVGDLTLDPLSGTLVFGDVTLNAGATLHLKAGTYNVNSLKVNGDATLIIDTGPVFLNIAGQGTNQPLDFTGGALSNPSFDPTMFRIVYAGTDPITLTGGMATAAMVYAPNSPVTVAGGSHFYGSIVGSEVKDTGGAKFHYDRRLNTDFMIAGAYMMSSFTWRKY